MPHHDKVSYAFETRNRYESKTKPLMIGLICSSAVTSCFVFVLSVGGIPAGVIIPSSAPIWMGTLTLGYMVTQN